MSAVEGGNESCFIPSWSRAGSGGEGKRDVEGAGGNVLKFARGVLRSMSVLASTPSFS